LDASGFSGLVIDNLSLTWLSPAASTQPFDVLIRAMNRLVLLVALTLLLCSSPARADICIGETLKVSHVSGHVVALWRGGEDPIPNASIQLSQLINDESQIKFTTTSDERGYFRIDNVPSGKYEILVTSQHFHAFGTRLYLKASKSKPSHEIVVTLGLGVHDCGSAVVRKLTR
jgi:hypothetical protein